MIAFVLSGGGNRGAAQAGALLGLIERGIYPQLIIGTSVGALNGAACAADPTSAGTQRIIDVWHRVRRADIFPGNSFTVGWRVLTRRGSMHPQRNFQRFVKTMFSADVHCFADLRIPCIVTATALGSGKLRLFGTDPHESLLDALLASTAIPPFFPPYHYGDEWFVDGAVVSNLPLVQALERGAREIYALEIVDNLSAVSAYTLGQTLSYSLRAMLRQQREMEHKLAMLVQQGITVHTIRLTVDDRLAYDDFSTTATLIETGYQTTINYLDALPAPRTPPYRRVALVLSNLLRTFKLHRASPPPPLV